MQRHAGGHRQIDQMHDIVQQRQSGDETLRQGGDPHAQPFLEPQQRRVAGGTAPHRQIKEERLYAGDHDHQPLDRQHGHHREDAKADRQQ